jgi:glutaminyl-peptide cyclotransferase
MRTSTLLLVALGVLGACLGAALTRRQQADGKPREAGSVQAGDRIDKSAVVSLPPMKAPPQIGENAFEHARTLVGFGPRYAGVPGWSQQLDHIQKTLEGAAIAVRRDTWTDRKELITFTNVIATIPGKRRERIVLACHHDTKCTTGHPDPKNNFHFVGANDGASAVGLLLALAPVLASEEREATIELVFFDGEESLDFKWNDGARALFGSKRFVKAHRDALLLGTESRIEAVILLDMVGRTELHIQEELFSTKRLRELTWSAAVACGHQQFFHQRAESAADDHKPFLDVGIPAVDLIDLNGNLDWHTPNDTLDRMSSKSLQIVADVVLTMLPEVERLYVLRK